LVSQNISYIYICVCINYTCKNNEYKYKLYKYK
jgi:hypothetical protein